VRQLDLRFGSGADSLGTGIGAMAVTTPIYALGGGGIDHLSGGRGNDVLFGEGGDDVLKGGDGTDELHGGDNADWCYGDGGTDHLFGDAGEDHLLGGMGSDDLHGGNGNDTLDGNENNDQLFGDAQIDTLTGDVGEDVLSGGAGNDRLNVTFNFDKFLAGHGAAIVPITEFARISNNGTDTIDVTADMKSIMTSYVRPTMDQLRVATGGIQSAIDAFSSALEIVSHLKFQSDLVNGRFLGAYQAVTLQWENPLQPMVNELGAIRSLKIPTAFGNMPMGTGTISSAGFVQSTFDNSFHNAALDGTIDQLRSLGLDFSLLTNKSVVTQLALGSNIPLFRGQLPDVVSDNPIWRDHFTLVGLPFDIVDLEVEASISARFSAGGQFGIDRACLRTGVLMDGFYASPTTGAAMQLDVGLAAGAHILGFGASVGGSIGARVNWGWTDAQADGKIRAWEMEAGFTAAASIPYRVWVSADASFFGSVSFDIASGEIGL
jgi:Ca2+-binding RTX toxin-like protein